MIGRSIGYFISIFNGVNFTLPGALHLKIEGYLQEWEVEK